MGIYRRRDITAQLIWDDLKMNGDSAKWQVCQRCSLTGPQFEYGKGFLLDELQTRNGQPLIWQPRHGVYSLTQSEGDWLEYLLMWRLRSVATQMRRIEQAAIAGGMRFGTSRKKIRLMIASITALRNMVEAMLP